MGDLHHIQCTDRKCGERVGGKVDESAIWSATCIPEHLESNIDPNKLRFHDMDALQATYFRCQRCGNLSRPNVWFCHDRNYVPRMSSVERRDSFNKWLEEQHNSGKRIVVIECGGGMAIPSVRVESEDAVENATNGSLLVRLNPSDCKVPSQNAVGIPFGAAEGIRLIDTALTKLRAPPERGGASIPKASQGAKSNPIRDSLPRNIPAGASQAKARPKSPQPIASARGKSPPAVRGGSKPSSRSSLARAGAAAIV